MSEKPGLLFKHGYSLVSAAVLLTLGVGTMVYHFVENLRWLDAVYLSVITLATVGYGDFTPKTDIGKIFTMIYVLFGIGIIVTFTNTFIQRATNRRAERVEKSQSDSGNS